MMTKNINKDLLKSLSKKERNLLEKIAQKTQTNSYLSKRLCVYLSGQISQGEMDHFLTLGESETKNQACIEYMAIALTSGEISYRDLKIFL